MRVTNPPNVDIYHFQNFLCMQAEPRKNHVKTVKFLLEATILWVSFGLGRWVKIRRFQASK